MKTRVIIFLLLMLMAFTAIYASENPAENEVYVRKNRELKALSEKFKAETGFEGTFEYNYNTMKLSSYSGSFSDIQLPATQDTTSIRQTIERVVDKMLPHLSASRTQLTKTAIFTSMWGNGTRYMQVINGYPIEGGGYLNITYNQTQNRVDILDATVDIPQEPIGNMIKKEDAIRIYYENVEVDEEIKYKKVFMPKFRLRYCNVNKLDISKTPDYRLCWVGGASRYLAIDAVTGKMYINNNGTSNDVSVSVMGKVYLYSDNDNNMRVDSRGFVNTFTSAICDSIATPTYTNHLGLAIYQGTHVDSLQSCLLSENFMQVKLSNGDDVMPSSINEAVTPIEIVYDCTNIPGKPSNLYYHAGAFFEKLSSFLGSAADSILIPPVIISNASLQPDENGETENANALIRISAGNGCYSSALCHEMTHLFIYNILNNNTMAPTGNNLHKAMNEAFPSYFPCVYRSNSIYRSYLYTKDLSDSTLTVESVHNNNLENYGLTLNEEFYSSYFNRFPISSAWWSLRNNPVFGLPDPVTNVKAFDNLLVYVLKNRVASNDSTRYKPRYFYNLLMKEIATDTHSWGLNDRQLAIKDAYNARGLHFYPKVESISGGQKGKNIFGLNE
ncbi:MAG: hypothetical protein CVU50_02940, partial [Candidatus Cloacimonetes bacterium HGW-Cloacimonetes-3]